MARKQHPMRGKSVGSDTCHAGPPSKRCGAPVTLVVSQFGPIYYSCGACGSKTFWGAPDSENYLLEREAQKEAQKEAENAAPVSTSNEKVKSNDDMFA